MALRGRWDRAHCTQHRGWAGFGVLPFGLTWQQFTCGEEKWKPVTGHVAERGSPFGTGRQADLGHLVWERGNDPSSSWQRRSLFAYSLHCKSAHMLVTLAGGARKDRSPLQQAYVSKTTALAGMISRR